MLTTDTTCRLSVRLLLQFIFVILWDARMADFERAPIFAFPYIQGHAVPLQKPTA